MMVLLLILYMKINNRKEEMIQIYNGYTTCRLANELYNNDNFVTVQLATENIVLKRLNRIEHMLI